MSDKDGARPNDTRTDLGAVLELRKPWVLVVEYLVDGDEIGLCTTARKQVRPREGLERVSGTERDPCKDRLSTIHIEAAARTGRQHLL